MTGPLQTNKVKEALRLFDVFHTLDREKILKEFAKFPEKIREKSFFIQINTGKEITKSGIFPEDAKSFLELCKLHNINNIDGLMCIPPINSDPKEIFSKMKIYNDELGLTELSMGMSSDYLEASKNGATFVRIGSKIFGNRS